MCDPGNPKLMTRDQIQSVHVPTSWRVLFADTISRYSKFGRRFLAHIRPFGTLCTANSMKIQPRLDSPRFALVTPNILINLDRGLLTQCKCSIDKLHMNVYKHTNIYTYTWETYTSYMDPGPLWAQVPGSGPRPRAWPALISEGAQC